MTYLDIIDVNSVLHSAHNVESIGKERVNGCPNGGLIVLFRKIAYLLSTDHHVICVFDSKTDRKLIMPEYKANRSKVPEVILQSELAYNILTDLNISCLKVNGFEADDLIYNVCNIYGPVTPRVFIHSSDADLAHNVINSRIEVLPVNSNSYMINYNNFVEVFSEEDFRLPKNMITLKKVLLGDKSDNIKPFVTQSGISGRKILKRILDLTDACDAYDPVINRTRQFAEIMFEELKLSEEDLAVLSKRCDVFFPKECDVNDLIDPVEISSINVSGFAGTLRAIRCFEGLRSLNMNASIAPNVKTNEMLMDYGRRFKSGEFHVDKDLSLSKDVFGLDDSSVFIREL